MRPSLIFETLAQSNDLLLAGISQNRIYESQSLDSRPHNTGYILTLNFQETLVNPVVWRGPRALTVSIHQPLAEGRDYDPLTHILNICTRLLTALPGQRGTDGCQVTDVTPQRRSGNEVDEAWKTITRAATFGVLYDEFGT